ncbi:MAG: ABC transporter substrate-binding protein [Deltaproteobacteria bacterium]|nr:ABC transporter substrate-binding protein [Deltaproteobacteria bacterium]
MVKLLSLFGSVVYVFVPYISIAGVPTEQVRTTVDKVVAILQNPELKSESKREERRNQLRQAIYPRFDFTEMAKRALGSHWGRRTTEEQREFVKHFSELLEKSYVDQIDSYNSEKIAYVREVQDKDRAEVDTKILGRKGEALPVNYKLHLVNGEWKVYDVVIENISLVNNYRSQFNRVIATSSYEELIRRLKQQELKITTKGR